MKPSQVSALIKLLDDPDPIVYQQISGKLIDIGPKIIEPLEQVWEQTTDSLLQERIEVIISYIQQDNLEEKIRLWLNKKPDDLIQGAILLAKFHYPELNAAQVKMEIENIQQAIWLELQDNLTPIEKVNTFNQIFYTQFGFGGQLKNVFDPQNNLINTCLERKKGSPIMLGVIYLAIAQNLKLPMYGVDLPYHFALAFCKYSKTEEELTQLNAKSNVLFYINPISNGIMFSRAEIRDYLKRMKVEEKPSYFTPVSNRKISLALFNNLKDSYLKNNDDQRASLLQNFIDLFDE